MKNEIIGKSGNGKSLALKEIMDNGCDHDWIPVDVRPNGKFSPATKRGKFCKKCKLAIWD